MYVASKKKAKVSKPVEWNRIAVLIATIAVLFFFTRSTPFPAGTYWDLLMARDFDLSLGWVFFPETISLNIADSSASLLGLKAIYHIGFFLLCSLLCLWVFKSKEVLPGIIVLAVFALSMQAFLSLRMLLQLFFLTGLLTILDNNRLKNNFGILLIPITAAASAFGLNSWLLVALVACHAFMNKDYQISLVLCALTGLLFFPEGAAAAVSPDSVLSWHFIPPQDMKILSLLSGIILIINLITLNKLTHDDMPNLFFFAITGFMALINPSTTPIFILMGMIILFRSFAEIKPLSLNYHLAGIIALTAIIHVFLFLNPFGFKLNPSVRGQLGKNLSPLLEGYVEEQEIYNYEIGELAWKGLVSIEVESLPIIARTKKWKVVKKGNGEFELVPEKSFKPVFAPEISAPDQN